MNDTTQKRVEAADTEFVQLSEIELDEVSGGIVPIVVGAVWGATHVGLAIYSRINCR